MWKTYNSFCHWTERMLFKKKGCLFGTFIDLMIGVCWFGVSAVFFVAGFYYLLFCLVRWTWRKMFKKDDSSKNILQEVANESRPNGIGFDDTMDGLAYERYCAARLSLYGYTNIVVTKDSGDFGADIIATDREGNRVCIQCKKYQGSVSLDAVQEVHTSRSHYGCERAMVITTSTFTPSARQQAQECGVELISNFK